MSQIKKKRPHKTYPHMKCILCRDVVGHTILHLQNYHNFDGHILFNMEDEEPEKFQAIIKKYYNQTDEELTSKIHKKGAK